MLMLLFSFHQHLRILTVLFHFHASLLFELHHPFLLIFEVSFLVFNATFAVNSFALVRFSFTFFLRHHWNFLNMFHLLPLILLQWDRSKFKGSFRVLRNFKRTLLINWSFKRITWCKTCWWLIIQCFKRTIWCKACWWLKNFFFKWTTWSCCLLITCWSLLRNTFYYLLHILIIRQFKLLLFF